MKLYVCLSLQHVLFTSHSASCALHFYMTEFLCVAHCKTIMLFLFFLCWVCSVVTMISVFFLFLSCACCLMSEDDAYVDKLPNFEKRVDVLAGMVWSCPGWLPFFKISHYPLGLMMTGHFFYPQSTRLQRSFVIHDSFFPHNSQMA